MSSIFRELARVVQDVRVAFGLIAITLLGVFYYNAVGEVIENPDRGLLLLPEIINKGINFILNDALEAILVGALITGLFYVANKLRSHGF